MLGFLIGAVCLVGLIKTVRMGYGHRGFGGDCHGGRVRGGRGWGGFRGHGGFGGPRAALRALFERLDTSPGQEKVILASLEELWAKKRAISEEFLQTRKDVARSMRGEQFDEAGLQEAFGRQDGLLSQLRESVTNAMKTVHEALDERQRSIAGDLLEHGPFGARTWSGGGAPPWSRGGGPYRENVWM